MSVARRSSAALAVVLILSLATACSSDPREKGQAAGEDEMPLSWPGEHGEWCLPKELYSDLAYPKEVDFEGSDPLTIEAVRLVDSEGLRLVDAVVAPLGKRRSRFGPSTFPPVEDPALARAWRRAQPAEGAVIRPGTAHDLIAHIVSTGAGTATMSALDVTYRQGAEQYTARTNESLRLPEGEC